MPFGSKCEYKTFEDCVSNNQDKENPEAYCATLEDKTKESCNKTPQKVIKSYKAETKTLEGKDDGYIHAIVSTESVDRDGEKILVDAWQKRLSDFMKHPVLLSSHDYNDLTKQIGEWIDIKITDSGLEGVAKYYINQGNPEADWGYQLAKNGSGAYSVGFMAHDWFDDVQEKDTTRTYSDVELLEISQVTIPSNRDALATLRSKGVLSDIQEEIASDIIREDMKPIKDYYNHVIKQNINDRQKSLEDSHLKIVDEHGVFNQSTDSNGSHYMDKSSFEDQGMICGNCIHYIPDNACVIVEGNINEKGLCKLWIIPEDLMTSTDNDEETDNPHNSENDEDYKTTPLSTDSEKVYEVKDVRTMYKKALQEIKKEGESNGR